MPFLPFLQALRPSLPSLVNSSLRVVLGNEACDLDSAVSALAYAYLLHQKTVSNFRLPRQVKTSVADAAQLVSTRRT